MQCPSCGFQNMPGLKECVVCSTPLTSDHARESVLPPRAKNRTFRERVRIWLTSRPGWEELDRRLSQTHIHRTPLGMQPLSLRSFGMLLLSAIPGYSHFCQLRQKRTGSLLFAASIVSIAGAVIGFRSPVSDVLIWTFLALSMYSMCTAIDSLRGLTQNVERRLYSCAAITMIVLGLYLGTYTMARFAISPYMSVMVIIDNVMANAVKPGDTIMIWRPGKIRRGDLVVGRIEWNDVEAPAIGAIIGVPGDRISISDRLYVNGRAVNAALPPLARYHDGYRSYSASEAAERRLRTGEYWIVPSFNAAPDSTAVLNVGTIRRDKVEGRVVAVTSPPAHRQLIRRR